MSVRRKPAPACFDAIRGGIHQMKLPAMILQVVAPASESRSDLKYRIRRQTGVDARENAAKPLRRRAAPGLGPFLAGRNPFIDGFAHRALSFQLSAQFAKRNRKDWRVTIERGAGQDRPMITRNIGMLLLAIYLILVGLVAIVPAIVLPGIVTGILALLAGILILIGK
jgi:hypothetical protein